LNYYERHLGDYARDTAHLSMLEHGAYNLLLDRYYATEQGIPADQAHRLCRARTREERAAVDTVLQEFFSQQEGQWVHKRAETEIERYRAGEPEREAKKANEDARLRRHREERAQLFKALSDAREHAPWNASINELRERVKRCSQPLPATAPATPATATQTPDTKHQTPVVKENPLPPSGVGATDPPADPSAKPKVHEFPPGFDRFWQAYPRKTAKPQAAKAFARLRPDEPLLSRMLAALALQRQSSQWQRDDGQFIPHPSTWLNGRRWEDEVSAQPMDDVFAGAM